MIEVKCYHCKKTIDRKEDLIVAQKYAFFFIKPYHTHCYADLLKMKGITSGLVREEPINSASFNYKVIMISFFDIFLIAIILFLFWAKKLTLGLIFAFPIFLIASLPIGIRLYSYLKFEKKYDRQRNNLQ
jgi:hypothetical protein